MNQQDPSYPATSYANSTASGGRRAHVFNCHTDLYLEEAERHGWLIQIKSMIDLFNEGWTLGSIRQRLKKDPTCTIDSLGSPSDRDITPLRQGPPQDELPNFTLDEMHRQIVKFIIVDDQVSC
jgi:hypothetical protein